MNRFKKAISVLLIFVLLLEAMAVSTFADIDDTDYEKMTMTFLGDSVSMGFLGDGVGAASEVEDLLKVEGIDINKIDLHRYEDYEKYMTIYSKASGRSYSAYYTLIRSRELCDFYENLYWAYPMQLADHLGMPREQVYNYSICGSTTMDFINYLYENYEEPVYPNMMGFDVAYREGEDGKNIGKLTELSGDIKEAVKKSDIIGVAIGNNEVSAASQNGMGGFNIEDEENNPWIMSEEQIKEMEEQNKRMQELLDKLISDTDLREEYGINAADFFDGYDTYANLSFNFQDSKAQYISSLLMEIDSIDNPEKYNGMIIDMNSWLKQEDNSASNVMMILMQASMIESMIPNEDAIKKIVDEYEINIKKLLERVHELNPDAKILAVNRWNPFSFKNYITLRTLNDYNGKLAEDIFGEDSVYMDLVRKFFDGFTFPSDFMNLPDDKRAELISEAFTNGVNNISDMFSEDFLNSSALSKLLSEIIIPLGYFQYGDVLTDIFDQMNEVLFNAVEELNEEWKDNFIKYIDISDAPAAPGNLIMGGSPDPHPDETGHTEMAKMIYKQIMDSVTKHRIIVDADGCGMPYANSLEAIEGQTVTLKTNPDEGYEFIGWAVTKGNIEINADNTFEMGAEDVYIVGRYEESSKIKREVEVYSSGRGTAYANVTKGTKGTEVKLFADPKDGYELTEWKVVYGDVKVNDNVFKIGNEDVRIKAVFKKAEAKTEVVEEGNTETEENPTTGAPVYGNILVTVGVIAAMTYLLSKKK